MTRERLSARRTKLRWAWLTVAVVSAATAAQPVQRTVPDTLGQRMQACTPCHGQQGRASPVGYLPRIAGKPAGYLFNQLVNFRDGRRYNGAMTYLVEHLSDDYLREIAQYFASLDVPYTALPHTNERDGLLRRGEALATRGEPGRGLPACTQCHGYSLTGALPAIPGLIGLPADYISAQLGAWRTGSRRAASPDCMADIARRLSPDEVRAVAAWLASRPLPASTRPAAHPDLPLPLDCGSGLR